VGGSPVRFILGIDVEPTSLADTRERRAVAAALGEAPLFSSLSPRHTRQMARRTTVRSFPGEAFIFHQGDKGLGFYLILRGRVLVRRSGRTLARLGPGEFFGELALFDEGIRSADLIVAEPATVAVLPREEFWRFASDHRVVLKAVLKEMARRLQENDPGTVGGYRPRPLRTARGLAP